MPAASHSSRVRVSVDLAAFAHNLRRIRRQIGPRVRLLVAVKKNAYGHGLVEIGRAAVVHGADWLGVFAAEEGVRLRKAGVCVPILVFSVTEPDALADAIRHRLTITVTDERNARKADHVARKLGRRCDAHLKIDTGMGRLGFKPETALRSLASIRACPHVSLRGLYSHLADADHDPSFSRRQLAALLRFVAQSPAGFEIVHLGASGTLPQPEFHLDMVRVGIAAYGGHHALAGFKPVMEVRAQVIQVKRVPTGTGISYGRTFRTKRPSTIGLIGAGYGDGYPRSLGNCGWVSIRGRRASVCGRVCMDQFVVDVTRIPRVAAGDEAELIGPHVPASRLAEAAGTISYELFCSLGNTRA